MGFAMAALGTSIAPPSAIAAPATINHRLRLRILVSAPALLGTPEQRGEWLVRAGFSLGRMETAIRQRIPYL